MKFEIIEYSRHLKDMKAREIVIEYHFFSIKTPSVSFECKWFYIELSANCFLNVPFFYDLYSEYQYRLFHPMPQMLRFFYLVTLEPNLK